MSISNPYLIINNRAINIIHSTISAIDTHSAICLQGPQNVSVIVLWAARKLLTHTC